MAWNVPCDEGMWLDPSATPIEATAQIPDAERKSQFRETWSQMADSGPVRRRLSAHLSATTNLCHGSCIFCSSSCSHYNSGCSQAELLSNGTGQKGRNICCRPSR